MSKRTKSAARPRVRRAPKRAAGSRATPAAAHGSLAHRVAFERLVSTISTRFINLPPADVDGAISAALAEIGAFAGVDRSYVFQFLDNDTRVSNTHEWCAPGIAPAIKSLQRLPIGTFPWIMPRYLAGESVCFGDIEELPVEAEAERREFKRERIRSLASLPLKCAGEVLGFIGFDTVRAARRWDEDLIGLLRIVGEIFANALARRRADHARVDSEQRYRALLKNLDEIVYQIAFDDLDTLASGREPPRMRLGEAVNRGRLVVVSDRVVDILGYRAEEFIADRRLWLEIMHPEDRRRIELAPEPLLRGGATVTRLYRLRHKHSGEYRWFEDRSVAVFDEAGRPTGVTGLARDVTERKRQDDAIQASEAFLKLSQRIGRVGSWDWTPASGRVVWSDETFRIYGFQPHEFAGSFEATMAVNHPDDMERIERHVREMFANKRGGSIEYRIVRPDGAVRTLIGTSEVELDAKGEITRIVGTVRDITEQKLAERALRESEARFRRVAESNLIGILFWDVSGQITDANDAFLNMIGYTRAEMEAGELRWTDITPLEWRELDARAMVELNRTGVCKPFEKEYERKDGSRVSILLGGAFFEGSRERGVCFVLDITERKRAEIERSESEQRFRQLAENMREVFWLTDIARDRRVIYVSPAYESIWGKSVQALYENPEDWVEAIHPEDRPRVREAFFRAFTEGAFDEIYRIVRPDGETRWIHDRGSAVKNERGEIYRFAGLAEEITERKRQEGEMQKLSSAVQQTADVVIITNREGVIEYVNPAFEATTGFRREEAIGKTPRLVKSGRHDEVFYRELWTTILAGQAYRNVLINRKKDGSLYYEEKSITPIKDDDGKIIHFVSTGKDITDRMEAQQRLQFLAYHDVLTALPNRALLMDRLEQALARAQRAGRQLAVLFLDLDRFKIVNDTLGHEYGDRLLQVMARRLRECVRAGDTVARVSGDEFVITLEEVNGAEDAVFVARKILEAFAKPFDVFNRELFVTTSIGISFYPSDGTSAATLLRNADTAMYRAKEQGRNNYQFYSADMSTKAVARLTLETGLRRALERQEFLLYYQPEINLTSGEIIGVEALLRWRHGEDGLLLPHDFMDLLEETGLVLSVGEWVIKSACAQAADWQTISPQPLRVSVNLSARQFSDPRLTEIVREALAQADLRPELLELEITESLLMQHADATMEVLSTLGKMGVRFAIDDFGTGYSSLSYLKRFAIHTLKIDQSFVRDIPRDSGDASIVTTIVAMARNLRLGVVAEGVENEEQYAFLKACQCHAAQGNFFGQPMPPPMAAHMLSRGYAATV